MLVQRAMEKATSSRVIRFWTAEKWRRLHNKVLWQWHQPKKDMWIWEYHEQKNTFALLYYWDNNLWRDFQKLSQTPECQRSGCDPGRPLEDFGQQPGRKRCLNYACTRYQVAGTKYQVTGTWKQLPRTIFSSVLCTEYRVPSSWTLLAQTKLSSMYVPLSSVVHHPGYRFLGHPGQMETLCPLVH